MLQEMHIYQTAGQKNDFICLQETQRKDEFLQSVRVLHTQFRIFGTFMVKKHECWRVGYL